MWGCKKKLLKVHPEFEGEWQSYSAVLRIDHSGNAHYACGSCGTPYDNIYGMAKIKDGTIKICRGNCFDLKIDAYPFYDSRGNYVTTLGGERFYGCIAPANLRDTILSGTSANVYWRLANDSLFFDSFLFKIQYKKTTDTDWNTISHSTYINYGFAAYTLTGLQPATTYQWKVSTEMGDFKSVEINGSPFTTP